MAEHTTERNALVLSASRRTDIPAFYTEWFMACVEAGTFPVENPFNGRVRRIPARPETAPYIVFWSKNYGPFLRKGCAGALQRSGFQLFFHFTVNLENPVLEPRVPSLEDLLLQMRELLRTVPPKAVTWRFDPLCSYRLEGGRSANNYEGFSRIAKAMGRLGVVRCVTSFLNLYPKVVRRARHRGVTFLEMSADERLKVLLEMEEVLGNEGIALEVCCEKDLAAAVPETSRIDASSCISHRLLAEVYGGALSGRRDRGQRVQEGCGCMEAKDVGSYRHHPCRHRCLYCYANPVPLDRP